MAEHFITSTSLRGLRALGLQGERVSTAYAQLTALLRARLSPAHAALFAEPQPTRDDLVDWYAEVSGPVTPLVLLAGEARETAEDRIGSLVADIEQLAATLVDSGRDEEVLLGRMLGLAIHLPAADRIYQVGDQPVAVCWGYVEEQASDDAPSPLTAFVRVAEPPPTPAPPPAPPAPTIAAPPPVRASGWQWGLLLAGFLVAVILGAWLLRDLGREPVVVAAAEPAGDPALDDGPVGAPPRQDELVDAISRARDLRVWLAGLEHELAERKAGCEPEVLIVPAAVEEAPEPEAAEPEGQGPDALVIPEDAAADGALAFLDGCWQSVTDLVNQDDVPLQIEYCFAADGTGEVTVSEEDGGACRGPVHATISPNEGLIIATDEDIACDNGGSYSSWRIECTRGSDGEADCSGLHGEGGGFEVSIQR